MKASMKTPLIFDGRNIYPIKSLKKQGFEDVTRLTGGMTEWRNQNLPVVKK